MDLHTMLNSKTGDDMQPAFDDLHDAVARVRAQVHVLKLALAASHNESDIRAIIAALGSVEEDLLQAERMVG